MTVDTQPTIEHESGTLGPERCITFLTTQSRSRSPCLPPLSIPPLSVRWYPVPLARKSRIQTERAPSSIESGCSSLDPRFAAGALSFMPGQDGSPYAGQADTEAESIISNVAEHDPPDALSLVDYAVPPAFTDVWTGYDSGFIVNSTAADTAASGGATAATGVPQAPARIFGSILHGLHLASSEKSGSQELSYGDFENKIEVLARNAPDEAREVDIVIPKRSNCISSAWSRFVLLGLWLGLIGVTITDHGAVTLVSVGWWKYLIITSEPGEIRSQRDHGLHYWSTGMHRHSPRPPGQEPVSEPHPGAQERMSLHRSRISP